MTLALGVGGAVMTVGGVAGGVSVAGGEDVGVDEGVTVAVIGIVVRVDVGDEGIGIDDAVARGVCAAVAGEAIDGA